MQRTQRPELSTVRRCGCSATDSVRPSRGVGPLERRALPSRMAIEVWEILGIPLSGGGMGYAGWCVIEGWRARDWPTVPGEITSSMIDFRFGRGGPHYTPTVTYTYSIAGVRYQAERLQFGDPDYSFKSRAERRLKPYAVGSQILVRCDPDHPDRAVLEPGVGWDIYGVVVMLGAMFVLLVGGVLGYWH